MSNNTIQEVDPILARIKNKAASRDDSKKRSETLEKMYTEEGERRADEQKKDKTRVAAEKTRSLSTTFVLKGDLIRKYNELQLECRMDGYWLTYEKVFVCGLERLMSMAESERHEFLERFKKTTNV